MTRKVVISKLIADELVKLGLRAEKLGMRNSFRRALGGVRAKGHGVVLRCMFFSMAACQRVIERCKWSADGPGTPYPCKPTGPR